MHILLYVPDNRITRNFVPHLWPFVLQRLTPEEHRVTIIDRNAQRMTDDELLDFIRREGVDLVGMGFMTNKAQAAYSIATLIREKTGVRIVMGGPHVTELPEEPLGRGGHPQCADAVVRGEADDLWRVVLEDAKANRLKPIYAPVLVGGTDVKPSLKEYPAVRWDELDLTRFNLMRFVPQPIRKVLKLLGVDHDAAYILPIESGRGCPYGCDFCTVTGFFGDKIRFRDNDNVIAELKRLKKLSQRDNAMVVACFVDDNLAIDRARLKSLLREMIRNDACMPWFGQISMNLLRDEELLELMAMSGARCILVGLESLSPESLSIANKSFNRPDEYASILENLAKHNISAVTTFIFGLDSDRPGVALETVNAIEGWAPGFPIFNTLTPYPATPLYERLREEGRMTRPEHWLDYKPYQINFQPKWMSPEQLREEVRQAWEHSYSPASFRRAQRWFEQHEKPFVQQLAHFITRIFFRGLYTPQNGRDWIKVLVRNTDTIVKLVISGAAAHRRTSRQIPDEWRPAAVPPKTRRVTADER